MNETGFMLTWTIQPCNRFHGNMRAKSLDEVNMKQPGSGEKRTGKVFFQEC
jgi:hypothetical protein